MAHSRARPQSVIAALLSAALLFAARGSMADDPTSAPAPTAAPVANGAPTSPSSSELPPKIDDPAREMARLTAPLQPTFHLMGSLFFGDGLRFNNPYRLSTQLGTSAKSVSVTAPYVDLGVGLALGDAFGWQHGMSLNLSAALSGVSQAILVPSYLVMYRGSSARLLAFGRFGPAIITSPDANVGAELGVGGALFVTAKTAVSAEIVGDLFYGAGIRETPYPVYPILSFQLGLLFDHEVLP